jgi:hypothetical protein
MTLTLRLLKVFFTPLIIFTEQNIRLQDKLNSEDGHREEN